jgi:hypothetical protein
MILKYKKSNTQAQKQIIAILHKLIYFKLFKSKIPMQTIYCINIISLN